MAPAAYPDVGEGYTAAHQTRTLEVLCLGVRNLEQSNNSRRHVTMELLSLPDPQGAAFGTFGTPWILPKDHQKTVLFGESGESATFPLSPDCKDAPSVVSDPKFLTNCRLRLRLMASHVSTMNAWMKDLTSVLPGSLMKTVTDAVDEATAEIEGELIIPLDEIISEENKCLGCWLPLKSPKHLSFDEAEERDQLITGAELWVQAYVLPDAQNCVAQYNEAVQEEYTRFWQPHTSDPNGFDIMATQASAERADVGTVARPLQRSPACIPSKMSLVHLAVTTGTADKECPETKTGVKAEAAKAGSVDLLDLSLCSKVDDKKVCDEGLMSLSFEQEPLAEPPTIGTPPPEAESQSTPAVDFYIGDQPAPTLLYSLHTQMKFAALDKLSVGLPMPQSTALATMGTSAMVTKGAQQGIHQHAAPKPSKSKLSGKGMASMEQELLAGLSDSLRF